MLAALAARNRVLGINGERKFAIDTNDFVMVHIFCCNLLNVGQKNQTIWFSNDAANPFDRSAFIAYDGQSNLIVYD